MVLGICGIANAADAVEILSIGLVGTAAEDDLNLTSQRAGALNACIFAGMFLGGLCWGMLGDAVGRKRSLVLALAVNAVFGALSAASTNLGQLMVLRLLAGVGVGGSMPVVFALMSEFCPPSSRGKFMAMLASFWMVGSLYSASMGWLVIPWAGWRPFVLVAALPAVVGCVLLAALVPESPRYLSVMGRGREAGQVLMRAARMNGTHLPEDFTIPSFHHRDQDILEHKASLRTDAAGHPHAVLLGSGPGAGSSGPAGPDGLAPGPALGSTRRGFVARLRLALQHGWGRGSATLVTLLSPPLRSYTLPLGVAWVGLCGGWYCTVLWVPRYFEERGATGASVYAQTFAVSLANLPGNLASIWLVDRLGRRLTACICMAGACACALLFAAAPARGAWPLLAACVFNGVSVGGWNSLDMISAELYPTSLRASGFGFLNALGRVSSFLTTYAAGALLDVALWAPLAVAAVMLAAGSAAMLSLPEPAGKPLEDSFTEEDKEAEHGGGGDEGSTQRLLGARGSSGGSSRDPLRQGAEDEEEGAALAAAAKAGPAPERVGLLAGARG
ncbi:hypothetical protein HYH03_010714 [Edaphochlamys debaryana]|uniref:Major facilitator superfamily (MFS) profile domain-containing protein n=1 Tax=Edaphochlamys debaryana TaxID=47281 RepID=A0A835XWB7_9CHLO|nr:hypothetical protein HYH03_010714 [Edaphochlamys debaryana]|eukprot:KAG2490792.1 hypothetical protein HYH03_010714 [Edaphochlamys debaryana]